MERCAPPVGLAVEGAALISVQGFAMMGTQEGRNMKAGTRMSRSAEEEARYEQYAAYLRTEWGVASERSRAAYLSAVGRKGRLTLSLIHISEPTRLS